MKNNLFAMCPAAIPPLGVRGLKKLKRRIRQCEAEIENIRTLPYYTLFNRESERAADLQKAINKLAVISGQLA
ncbi:hypothetical protein ACLI09_07595 [Flavobacterium sp. RHBU_24]|uniref:hypothetical protein n=1 Tax=Flavobacterium sp. RHBU_24 TaxID=3391185 RepID=UPI0039855D85